MKDTTIFHCPSRVLTVLHSKHVKVELSGYNTLIASYTDECNTCGPYMFAIEDGDVDLTLELTSQLD